MTAPSGNAGTLLCWQLQITTPEADLEVTLTDTPDPIAVGADLAYKATVKNLGPHAAEKVTLKFDQLPTGATVTSATPTVGTCKTDVTPIVCELGDIAKDATVTVDLVVKPTTAGTATATASASTTLATDPAAANSSASTTTEVRATGSGGSEIVAVQVSGLGRGTVTSDPTGINCGVTCQAGFLAETPVTLNANPATGSVFAGWGGACETTPDDQPCVVLASGRKDVVATFDKAPAGGGGSAAAPADRAAPGTSARSRGRSVATPCAAPPARTSSAASAATTSSTASAAATGSTAAWARTSSTAAPARVQLYGGKGNDLHDGGGSTNACTDGQGTNTFKRCAV